MTAAAHLFAPLEAGEIAAAPTPKPADRPKPTPIVPVTDDAPPFAAYRHPEHGAPVQSWEYTFPDGATVGFMSRFDKPDGRKVFAPVVYAQLNGKRRWRASGFPEPRPLYNLHTIAARPDALVVVAEGEKTAEAAARLLPDAVATTPPHGAKSPHKADWSPLAGRDVVIATDADDAGRAFGRQVARLAKATGAARVRILPAEMIRTDPPEGWDIADFEAEGGDGETLASLIAGLPDDAPDAEPEADAKPNPKAEIFRVGDHGVERLVENDDGRREWRWFCSPLRVLALTRDRAASEWGYLLRIIDADGNIHLWPMPAAMLAGDGTQMREHLLRLGVRLAPGTAARRWLVEYLVTTHTKDRARCVTQPGWNGRAFVLPSETFGDTQGETVVFQTAGRHDDPFRVGGDLDGWREGVAAAARGNSRLVFGLSAAFAGPLLHLTGSEGGGFHFRGASSTGKSTLLFMAGGVWGGGGIGGFVRTWRATSNALEGIAAIHSDTLLCLDEMGQGEGRQVGEIAYMLAQGQGKGRMTRDASIRAVAEWRVFFISSGEVGVADKVAEDGRSRVMAGQAVRVIDLPADAGAGAGIFETVPDGLTPAAFAQRLKAAALAHHGHAGRAWLKALTDDPEAAGRRAIELQQAFIEAHSPSAADGQVTRAAGRFGLVAAAGEMVVAAGVLPWATGEATQAAARLFRDWIEARGGTGSLEAEQHVAAVRRFIEAHGASRFQPMGRLVDGADDGVHPDKIINRAGFRRRAETGDGFEHLILPETWRAEVCAGLDAAAVARTLIERGFMAPGEAGKAARKVRLPGFEGAVRAYVIRPNILAAEAGMPPIGTTVAAGQVPF
jgi:putative DNA primase/helicase